MRRVHRRLAPPRRSSAQQDRVAQLAGRVLHGADELRERHQYRVRNPAWGRLDGDVLPADLAANAASLGARVERVATIDELRACPADAKASKETRPFFIHVEVDPLVPAPDSGAWWDVPVAATSELDSVRDARVRYEDAKRRQRPLI